MFKGYQDHNRCDIHLGPEQEEMSYTNSNTWINI